MGTLRRRFASWMTFSVLIVLAAAVFSLIGCNSDQTQTKSTFSYSEDSDPASLDPALVDDVAGGNVVRYMFDGLVTYDSTTSEAKPAIAESWESNADATEFTFHLRSGAKFTDGTEINAQSFVDSWTRALAPATQSSTASAVFQPVMGASALSAGETDKLAGVQAIDASTLKVTLEYPMADFVSLLGHPAAAPVPLAAAGDKQNTFGEHPVGNGPYMLSEWKRDDSLVLVKNPDYYGSAGTLDQITVKIIPNPATAVAELKAGNVDAVRTLPPGQSEALRSDSSVKFFTGDADSVRFVGFDTTKAPFDNQKVREAFAYAIDQDAIANKVLQGQESPADGIVPTAVPGHQNGAMAYNFDPEKAKVVLAEAGFPDGQGLPQLTLYYPGVGPAADAAQAIQSQLRNIGVQVEIAGLDEGAFTEQMIAGDFSIFLIGWQADAPNADGYLFPLFDSENMGATDVFKYANPEVDDLLGKARSTTDPGQRTGFYNDAERKILVDSPVVPVSFGQENMIYAPRVTKFVVTPLGDIALNEITVSK